MFLYGFGRGKYKLNSFLGVPTPFGHLCSPTIHYALHMQAISDISYWCPAIYMAHKSEMGAKWPGHFAYALTMSYSQLREIY